MKKKVNSNKKVIKITMEKKMIVSFVKINNLKKLFFYFKIILL